MVTASVTTLYLAMLLGLVCVAAGLGGLARPDDWRRIFDELEASPGLMLAIAFIAILFGLVVILTHRAWTDPLAIVVSLAGWLSFAEGLALLSVPRWWIGLVKPLLRYARAWSAVALLLGLFLLAAGLTGRADPILAQGY